MAILNITEYEDLARDSQGNVILAGKEPRITSQNVTYTTSAQSAAFSGKTKYIRVVADAVAYLDFGTNPTSTLTDTRLPSGVVEFYGVEPGHKVSAYDGTS